MLVASCLVWSIFQDSVSGLYQALLDSTVAFDVFLDMLVASGLGFHFSSLGFGVVSGLSEQHRCTRPDHLLVPSCLVFHFSVSASRLYLAFLDSTVVLDLIRLLVPSCLGFHFSVSALGLYQALLDSTVVLDVLVTSCPVFHFSSVSFRIVSGLSAQHCCTRRALRHAGRMLSSVPFFEPVAEFETSGGSQKGSTRDLWAETE